MLSTVISLSDPAEATFIRTEALEEMTNVELNLTIASLAKANTALMDAEIFADLSEEQPSGQAISPPDSGRLGSTVFFRIEALPEQEQALITEQAQVVLGFNLAT